MVVGREVVVLVLVVVTGTYLTEYLVAALPLIEPHDSQLDLHVGSHFASHSKLKNVPNLLESLVKHTQRFI